MSKSSDIAKRSKQVKKRAINILHGIGVDTQGRVIARPSVSVRWRSIFRFWHAASVREKPRIRPISLPLGQAGESGGEKPSARCTPTVQVAAVVREGRRATLRRPAIVPAGSGLRLEGGIDRRDVGAQADHELFARYLGVLAYFGGNSFHQGVKLFVGRLMSDIVQVEGWLFHWFSPHSSTSASVVGHCPVQLNY